MKYPEDSRLREQSGNVNNKDPLVSFLYILMRDYIVPNDIETIISNYLPEYDTKDVHFANGWLANYAEDVAKRLKGGIH